MGNSFSNKYQPSKHEQKCEAPSSSESVESPITIMKKKKRHRKKKQSQRVQPTTQNYVGSIRKESSFSKKLNQRPFKRKSKLKSSVGNENKMYSEHGSIGQGHQNLTNFPEIIITSPSDVEASLEIDKSEPLSYASSAVENTLPSNRSSAVEVADYSNCSMKLDEEIVLDTQLECNASKKENLKKYDETSCPFFVEEKKFSKVEESESFANSQDDPGALYNSIPYCALVSESEHTVLDMMYAPLSSITPDEIQDCKNKNHCSSALAEDNSKHVEIVEDDDNNICDEFIHTSNKLVEVPSQYSHVQNIETSVVEEQNDEEPADSIYTANGNLSKSVKQHEFESVNNMCEPIAVVNKQKSSESAILKDPGSKQFTLINFNLPHGQTAEKFNLKQVLSGVIANVMVTSQSGSNSSIDQEVPTEESILRPQTKEECILPSDNVEKEKVLDATNISTSHDFTALQKDITQVVTMPTDGRVRIAQNRSQSDIQQITHIDDIDEEVQEITANMSSKHRGLSDDNWDKEPIDLKAQLGTGAMASLTREPSSYQHLSGVPSRHDFHEDTNNGSDEEKPEPRRRRRSRQAAKSNSTDNHTSFEYKPTSVSDSSELSPPPVAPRPKNRHIKPPPLPPKVSTSKSYDEVEEHLILPEDGVRSVDVAQNKLTAHSSCEIDLYSSSTEKKQHIGCLIFDHGNFIASREKMPNESFNAEHENILHVSRESPNVDKTLAVDQADTTCLRNVSTSIEILQIKPERLCACTNDNENLFEAEYLPAVQTSDSCQHCVGTDSFAIPSSVLDCVLLPPSNRLLHPSNPEVPLLSTKHSTVDETTSLCLPLTKLKPNKSDSSNDQVKSTSSGRKKFDYRQFAALPQASYQTSEIHTWHSPPPSSLWHLSYIIQQAQEVEKFDYQYLAALPEKKLIENIDVPAAKSSFSLSVSFAHLQRHSVSNVESTQNNILGELESLQPLKPVSQRAAFFAKQSADLSYLLPKQNLSSKPFSVSSNTSMLLDSENKVNSIESTTENISKHERLSFRDRRKYFEQEIKQQSVKGKSQEDVNNGSIGRRKKISLVSDQDLRTIKQEEEKKYGTLSRDDIRKSMNFAEDDEDIVEDMSSISANISTNSTVFIEGKEYKLEKKPLKLSASERLNPHYGVVSSSSTDDPIRELEQDVERAGHVVEGDGETSAQNALNIKPNTVPFDVKRDSHSLSPAERRALEAERRKQWRQARMNSLENDIAIYSAFKAKEMMSQGSPSALPGDVSRISDYNRETRRFKSLEADALQAQMMLQQRGRKSDGTSGSSGAQTHSFS